MTLWLLDTGPLVAFFDRSDSCHEWSKVKWAQAPIPLLTCEPVLAEAAYLLGTRAGLPSEKLLSLIDRGIVSVPFRLENEVQAVSRILEHYRDQQIQLADACLIRMSEINRHCRVFTIDKEDFQIFRRFERQVIPLVAPD